jgi:hypothetical protein
MEYIYHCSFYPKVLQGIVIYISTGKQTVKTMITLNHVSTNLINQLD